MYSVKRHLKKSLKPVILNRVQDKKGAVMLYLCTIVTDIFIKTSGNCQLVEKRHNMFPLKMLTVTYSKTQNKEPIRQI